jgi:hypothetical protein
MPKKPTPKRPKSKPRQGRAPARASTSAHELLVAHVTELDGRLLRVEEIVATKPDGVFATMNALRDRIDALEVWRAGVVAALEEFRATTDRLADRDAKLQNRVDELEAAAQVLAEPAGRAITR